jgi:curli biogenesis system outer membrane secretion channel CsgG
MRIRRALLAAALWAAAPTFAMAEPVVVDAEGSGPTRDDAVAQALTEAIQQVTGLALASAQQMRTAMSGVSMQDGSTVALAEESQLETSRLSHGIVRSFRVIAVNQDGSGFTAHLSVAVEKFVPKGLGNDSRRRIAVAAFGGPPSTRGLGEMLRDRITAALTQARRFAVVDRANDGAYAQEMAVVENGPLAERVRAGQVIGADYIVTGTIRQAGVSRSEQTIELTGEHVESASSAIEVDFQVMEIATRQVKWGDTVRFSAGGGALSGLVERAASRVTEEITQTIYPMRLIKFDDPTELIINQGGSGVQPGQRFRAMLLGEQLVDPYTKEPLGQSEKQIGVIEVQRVDSKVSYARLISGRLPPAGSEVVLRAGAASPSRAAHSARQPSRPVVKLPGDL